MAYVKGNILVIDGSIERVDALTEIFSINDYRVLWASNGNDGIRMAESDEPDVVLIHIDLPDMKGSDVCRNLRLRNSTWSVPIIILTPRPEMESEVLSCLELGANDCVAVPVRKTELLGRVGVLIRMKRVEDKLRRLYIERTRELEWSNMELQKIRTQLILKNQMSTLGLMVAVAAHEIRSPAASISGNLEVIGQLLQSFIADLSTLAEKLHNTPSDDVETMFDLLRFAAEENLHGAPIDMQQRRIDARRIEAQLQKTLAAPFDDDLPVQLAKYRLGDPIESVANTIARYGIAGIQPIFTACELIIKFKNMQISIERINAIVQAMKAYSHIDRAELQAVQVHSGLDDTLTIMNYIFRGNVELVKRYADELPTPLGYPGELNQVWTNLLQNAYDALEEGRGRIIVETGIEVRGSRSYISVRITDNGRGIPKEILPHIFDSFFTTKEKGKGSGLGLDICKRIIEKHHGVIEVQTAPGATTSQVLLPIDQKSIAMDAAGSGLDRLRTSEGRQ